MSHKKLRILATKLNNNNNSCSTNTTNNNNNSNNNYMNNHQLIMSSSSSFALSSSVSSLSDDGGVQSKTSDRSSNCTSATSTSIIPIHTVTTKKSSSQRSRTSSRGFRLLPGLKATSFFTILMLVCLETVLLSTVSNCAKTFYMHWNTSNSIFRIDNTDHIIDVNKGNLAFEFDQVHIICPVYEPGTFENETEKYIIYNVSKVEYETCRITNADPRVIAICDKPQKLMFFTITFRPFTPQPGGLEFLPGNDYYFISTSSKDDLYRRIGGRCSTNNMKVVFKVCCAPEDKNNRSLSGGGGGSHGGSSVINTGGNGGHHQGGSQQQHNNNIINGHSTSSNSGGSNGAGTGGGNSGTSINTNIDQFNRIPVQQNNNGVQQTGIRINNMPQNPNGPGGGMYNGGANGGFIPPMTNVNTNTSNVVQSTMSWPGWGGGGGGMDGGMVQQHSTPVTTIGIQPHFYPPHMTSPRPNINSAIHNNSNYSPSHKPTKKTNEYDKHPNEVVKNEELTYNSGSSPLLRLRRTSSLLSQRSRTSSSTSQLLRSSVILVDSIIRHLTANYNPIILTTILVTLTNFMHSTGGTLIRWR